MPNNLVPESVYDGLTPRGREIAAFYIQNPESSYKQIAENFKISTTRVYQLLSSSRFFKVLRLEGTNRLRRKVVKAADTLIEKMDSQNDIVGLKAAVTILENEGILGPQQINLQINDMRSKSPEELNAILTQAKEIPKQSIIEAQLVKDE